MGEKGNLAHEREHSSIYSLHWLRSTKIYEAIKEVRLLQLEIREERKNFSFRRRNGIPIGEGRGMSSGQISLTPSAEADDHLLIAAELNMRDGREPGYGLSPDSTEPPEAA